MADLEAQIGLTADSTGVEAGVGKAKKSLASLGASANTLGQQVSGVSDKAGKALGGLGDNGERASKKIERDTRSMQGSLQRYLATLEGGSKNSRKYWESLAEFRGVDKNALAPLLSQLDSATAKSKLAESATAGWRTELGRLAPVMGSVLSGAALLGFAGKLVSVQREFDVLNSSLKTVTGSSAAAEREMSWLKDFAKETPFGLAQATQGFVKMKALGLEPTRASLTSFGNTASAMGKDLNQMIEAVADASTGEFERLKEFGIKAKKEGDSVALTFQGVTTTVKNNADEITGYLEKLGNSQFAGAMAERAKTLDGAISELGDTWDALFRTVSQNAAGSLIYDSVRLASGAVSDLTEVIRALTSETDRNVGATGAMSAVQNGLGTVFETVAALGLNVKYVLTQVGNELGGLAAQAAAVASLQFGQAAEIGRMMKADAAAARAEVDATTARVLGARRAAQDQAALSAFGASATPGLDNYLNGMLRNSRPRSSSVGTDKAKKGAAAKESEEARAYAQAMEAIAKAQLAAVTSGEAYTSTQQRLLDIMTSPTWRKMPESWRVLIAQQGEAAILAEQNAAAQKALTEQRKRDAEAMAASISRMKDGNAALREEIDTIGMSSAEKTAYTQAINEATIAKLEERVATLDLFEAESDLATSLSEQIKTLQDRNALLGNKAAAEAAQQAAEATREANARIAEDSQKAYDQMGQALADALMEGGKSAGEYIKGLFRTMVLRPTIQAVVSPFAGALNSALGGVTGAPGGGMLGSLSNVSSLAQLFGGGNVGAMSGLFGGTMSFANAAGSVAANSMAGMGMYGGNSLSAFLATNGAYGTAGSAAGLGSIAAGASVIAAPLIIGALAERNSRDRISGAAFATSAGNDPLTQTLAGSVDFDYLTGTLPDRQALLSRLEELGAPMETIAAWNDRALAYLTQAADAANRVNENGPNWKPMLENFQDMDDFYRGAGYANPEALGWWNNKGNGILSNDPALTEASRAIAQSIVAPLTSLTEMMGGAAADFRASVGVATRGQGNGVWAGLNISRDGQSLADWVNMDDFDSVDEAMRGVYSSALDVLGELDLPAWARTQVDGARTQLDQLSGENVGAEAEALYRQASAGIAQMYGQIKLLIDVFPDFAGATQDSVYALQTLMGGLDSLTSAYASYTQTYWTDAERTAFAREQISAALEAVNLALPTSIEGFRALVEAQDLNTDAGREAFAALMGVADAFAQVTPAADAAAATFEASGDLAGLIRDGLLGTFDGESLGVAMAQTVQDGVYAALAGGFAQQITDIIVGGVVNPVIQAAVTGSSISAAVSQSSIDAMVAQASAVASAYAAIVNDPAFQAAMDQIGAAVSSIGGSVTSYNPAPVRSYTSAVIDSGVAAEKAADDIRDAWRDIADTLLDEVARIRGAIADDGDMSMAYWLEQFATSTAAARAGDQEAAQRLTSLSADLLRTAESEAGSLLEMQQMRAWVAQSLQDTAGYATRYAGGAAPASTVTASAPSWGFGFAPAPMVTAPAADPAVANALREIQQQQADQARALADMQLQWLRIVRRWDNEGMPSVREEA